MTLVNQTDCGKEVTSIMCTRQTAFQIIDGMSERIRRLFPEGEMDVILYGSYARNEQTEESDIDILYLVEMPRESISSKEWQIGEAAAELTLEYGVVVSPVVENRDYFNRNSDVLPFFANIQREGVKLGA